MEGKTQEAVAAAAGMSMRTVRSWQNGPLPSEGRTSRAWRTRPDSFASIWGEAVEPLLQMTRREPCRPPRSWSGWKNAIRDGSALPNSGLYNGASGTGVPCMARNRRSSFRRYIHRAGKPNWISPTLASCESPSPASPLSTYSSSSSSSTRGGGGWAWPSERPLKPCSRVCRVRCGAWVGRPKWSAPTISRQRPTS